MNALPGRCSTCGERVFWTGVQWSDERRHEGRSHTCSPEAGTIAGAISGPGDAQTSPVPATPDRTGGDSG